MLRFDNQVFVGEGFPEKKNLRIWIRRCITLLFFGLRTGVR